MDIESKSYRIRSTGIAGQVEITIKANGRSVFVTRSDLPSVTAMATMPESAFNRAIAGAIAAA